MDQTHLLILIAPKTHCNDQSDINGPAEVQCHLGALRGFLKEIRRDKFLKKYSRWRQVVGRSRISVWIKIASNDPD